MKPLKLNSSKRPATKSASPTKRLKYGNKPTVIGAEKFRSKREAARWQALLWLATAGRVAGLSREVPFVLAPGVKIEGEKRARPALRYVADFVYSDVATGRIVVEDCKGASTDVYRLKKHLMKTVHGVDVLET
jgi:hypothetical protein